MEIANEVIERYFSLGLSYDEILLYLQLAHNKYISRRTLQRRITSLGLYRRKHYTNIGELLSFITNEIANSGQLHGYKWMHLKCRQNGIVVQQEAVRLALNILDPEGVTLRRRNRLRRREYFSKGPNFLWHIDSYDKLKPYGIAINGCIDGFSRYVLWLKAAFTNSDPAVISGYFMDTVKFLGGCPKMVRTDMGTENRYIEQIQTFFGEQKKLNEILFIYGKSTSNQRIECWWSMLRKHSAQFWMNLFQNLKDNGHFNGSFIDKSLVQFVFMDIIQNDLDQVCFEWNTHRITGKKTSVAPMGRPFTMLELPQLYGTRDYLSAVSPSEITICQEECKYIEYSCDKDVYDLCKIIMEEKSFNGQNDPFKAINLYLALREEINRLL